jgi:hypothetical protein
MQRYPIYISPNPSQKKEKTKKTQTPCTFVVRQHAKVVGKPSSGIYIPWKSIFLNLETVRHVLE